MTLRPKNVVFDIGNVLIGWDPMVLYRKVFDGDQEKASWFLANVCTMDWNLEQDRGRSFGDAVKILSAQHPEWADAIAAYDQRWTETITGPIAGSVAVLKDLHAQGTPVYAITNWNDEKFAETRERFDFLDLFRDTVVSAIEGVIKPDPEIFAILCRRNTIDAEDCIFIDDSAKNVAGARAFGMAAHHFTEPQALRAELQTYGLM